MSAFAIRRMGIVGTALAAGALALSLSPAADAISRDEVMAKAKAFAYHPWRCTSANLTASCSGSYHSVFTPGDYLGLPYDWGGYMSTFRFDQEIAQGYGAGSYPNDGVLDCTSGLDCSGYVSQCWGTGHNTTSSIPGISTQISQSSMLAGDVFNEAGYHVVLYSHTLPNGDPVFYEALGYHVSISPAGWSHVSGFSPRRYDNITGADAGNPIGTSTNPIVVPPFPGSLYSDTRNTAQSASDVLDGCGAAPGTNERGPEYIYQVTINQPGQLRATVSGDVPGSVDVDVHLYTSMNTNDCIARNNTEFIEQVDCGTYYVVVDTYGSDASMAGQYTLQLQLQNPSGSCGSGPPGYDFEGGLGFPCSCNVNGCSYCNYNLGVDACLSVGTTSYCSGPCETNDDCASSVPGACCEPVSGGELYCLLPQHCNGGTGGNGTGGNGTGANGGVGAGNGAGANDILGPPPRDDDDGEEAACAVASAGHGGTKGGGLALVTLLLLGPAAWRRRRARNRRAA